MTAQPESTLQPVLTLTDAARAMVLEVRSEEDDADRLALWVEVSGVAAGAYTYDMYFQAAGDASPEDAVQHHDALTVVIAGASVDKVAGSTLDVSEVGGEAGLVMVNPNAPELSPAMAGRPPADLSGPVAQQVLSVLDTSINPSIAAHGGRADLVAVEEGTAYLRLSGGCQGCGLATVTLSQGIEVAIKEAVPEITSVVDVTDHASGANPYHEPAKK
ncbi:MAG: NifU family protein [Acidimicrobiales bacterium]